MAVDKTVKLKGITKKGKVYIPDSSGVYHELILPSMKLGDPASPELQKELGGVAPSNTTAPNAPAQPERIPHTRSKKTGKGKRFKIKSDQDFGALSSAGSLSESEPSEPSPSSSPSSSVSAASSSPSEPSEVSSSPPSASSAPDSHQFDPDDPKRTPKYRTLANRMATDNVGLFGAVKQSVSERMKYRADKFNEAKKPENIAKALFGRTVATMVAKRRGASSTEIKRVAGVVDPLQPPEPPEPQEGGGSEVLVRIEKNTDKTNTLLEKLVAHFKALDQKQDVSQNFQEEKDTEKAAKDKEQMDVKLGPTSPFMALDQKQDVSQNFQEEKDTEKAAKDKEQMDVLKSISDKLGGIKLGGEVPDSVGGGLMDSLLGKTPTVNPKSIRANRPVRTRGRLGGVGRGLAGAQHRAEMRRLGGVGRGLAGVGRLGGVARGLAGGLGGALGGVALDYAGNKLDESGHEKLGAAAHIGSSAMSGMGMGAMVGGLFGPAGVVIGGGLGAAAGAAYGAYENWDKIAEPSAPLPDRKPSDFVNKPKHGKNAPKAVGNFMAGKSNDEFTKNKEGFVPSAYLDPTGNLTIGYGHLITDEEKKQGYVKLPDGTKINFSKGEKLTKEQGDSLYNADANGHTNEAFNNLRKKGVNVDALGENTKNAIADLAFNAGPSIFNKTPGLVAALKNNDIANISKELKDVATTSGGETLPGLITRASDRSNMVLADVSPTKSNMGAIIDSSSTQVASAARTTAASSSGPVVVNNVTNNNAQPQQNQPNNIQAVRAADTTPARKVAENAVYSRA